MFSYFLIRSFLLYGKTPGKVRQLLLVNFIRGHVCITVVKMSNLFYLRLVWCKSLFQVVTKCVNNYRFFNYVPFTDPYSLKHLLVNKISVNTVLMRQLQTNLIIMNNVLFGSHFKVILYLFSLQKFSNFQFTTLKCFSRISLRGF